MQFPGRCQYHGCKRGRNHRVEAAPGVWIFVCPKHKRLSEGFNLEERKAFDMKINQQMKELAEEEVKIVPITGGKLPPSEVWLDNLPMNCTFVCQKPTNWLLNLEEYTLKGRRDTPTGSITLLRENRKEGNEDISYWKWEDSRQFSAEYILRKILDG